MSAATTTPRSTTSPRRSASPSRPSITTSRTRNSSCSSASAPGSSRSARHCSRAETAPGRGRDRLREVMRDYAIAIASEYGWCMVRAEHQDLGAELSEQVRALKAEIDRGIRRLLQLGMADGSIADERSQARRVRHRRRAQLDRALVSRRAFARAGAHRRRFRRAARAWARAPARQRPGHGAGCPRRREVRTWPLLLHRKKCTSYSLRPLPPVAVSTSKDTRP